MSGVGLFAAITGVCLFGFYRVIEGNAARTEARREKREMRAALLPYLQAEEDKRWIALTGKAADMERKVMRNEPGWEAGKSVYKTPGVWFPPGENRFG